MGLFGKKESLHLRIEGMTCNNCVGHVTKALEGVDGVRKVAVDLEGKEATVSGRADMDRAALVAAVVAAGYEAV